MPYFPSEQDWSLTVRPERIPLSDRFPARYAVNSLSNENNRHSGLASKPPRRKQYREVETRNGHKNPNLIPLTRSREKVTHAANKDPRHSGFDGTAADYENTDETYCPNTPGWD